MLSDMTVSFHIEPRSTCKRSYQRRNCDEKKTHQKLKSFMGPIRVIRTRISQPILHFSQSLCIQIATGCLDSVTRCSQRSVQYSYYKNLCLLNWVNIILLLECTFVRNKSFPSYVTHLKSRSMIGRRIKLKYRSAQRKNV